MRPLPDQVHRFKPKGNSGRDKLDIRAYDFGIIS